jgi:hypothetical protein
LTPVSEAGRPVPLQNVAGCLTCGFWSGSLGSVILADHATGHLAALHRRVKRRQDIRDLMLRLTRENLARRCRRRRPSRPASLSTVPLSAGCPADVRHRQLIADGRGAVGVQVGSMGFKSASQADSVSYCGCDRVLRPVQVHIPAGQPAEGLGRNPRRATDRSRRWSIYSNMGVWGRSPLRHEPVACSFMTVVGQVPRRGVWRLTRDPLCR